MARHNFFEIASAIGQIPISKIHSQMKYYLLKFENNATQNNQTTYDIYEEKSIVKYVEEKKCEISIGGCIYVGEIVQVGSKKGPLKCIMDAIIQNTNSKKRELAERKCHIESMPSQRKKRKPSKKILERSINNQTDVTYHHDPRNNRTLLSPNPFSIESIDRLSSSDSNKSNESSPFYNNQNHSSFNNSSPFSSQHTPLNHYCTSINRYSPTSTNYSSKFKTDSSLSNNHQNIELDHSSEMLDVLRGIRNATEKNTQLLQDLLQMKKKDIDKNQKLQEENEKYFSIMSFSDYLVDARILAKFIFKNENLEEFTVSTGYKSKVTLFPELPSEKLVKIE
ncbi:hypothetical protein SNEBB_009587, partial [Seison nebaliae]